MYSPDLQTPADLQDHAVRASVQNSSFHLQLCNCVASYVAATFNYPQFLCTKDLSSGHSSYTAAAYASRPPTATSRQFTSPAATRLRAWTSSSSSSLAISSSSLTASAASSASSVVPGSAASSASAASAPSKPSAPTPSPAARASPCARWQKCHNKQSKTCLAFVIV